VLAGARERHGAARSIHGAAIGRLHVRDNGADLAELLIELEEKEWARQWFVERLRK
jgi:hypothetical protein